MRPRINRTAVAVMLTAAAIIVPCTAWYVVGSKAARADAGELSRAPQMHAYKIAMLMAERLGSRLEAIREAESRRPFYHYQQLYHDPASSCECASVTPSPLSAGPSDPLVWTHFQIDPSYKLTLPTLGGDGQDEKLRAEWLGAQKSIYTALLRETFSCVQAIDSPSPFAALAGQDAAHPQESSRPATSVPRSSLWSTAAAHAGLGEPHDIERVEDFHWYTLEIDRKDSLVALRKVITEHGNWVQGFVISFVGIQALLEDSSFPAGIHKRAGDVLAPSEVEVDIPIECVDWVVSVDAGSAMDAASGKGDVIVASFHRLFLGGAVTALLAGACMIFLVWKTDRLAAQRSRFAASAAHELRTPLAGLRLYGEMLAEDLGDPARGRDYAGRIASEAERLGRVVSNVLGYSNLERGSLSLRPRMGDLGVALSTTLDRMRPGLEASGARLDLKVEEDIPPVRFDTDAVQHIVQNLVDNAEKYSRGAEDRTIHVELARQNGGVELSVRDHGLGVPSAQRRRLFKPFERGEDRDAPSGLGLGLVLVRSLVRAQDAFVDYADAQGGGARFTVTFPADAATPSGS